MPEFVGFLRHCSSGGCCLQGVSVFSKQITSGCSYLLHTHPGARKLRCKAKPPLWPDLIAAGLRPIAELLGRKNRQQAGLQHLIEQILLAVKTAANASRSKATQKGCRLRKLQDELPWHTVRCTTACQPAICNCGTFRMDLRFMITMCLLIQFLHVVAVTCQVGDRLRYCAVAPRLSDTEVSNRGKGIPKRFLFPECSCSNPGPQPGSNPCNALAHEMRSVVPRVN